MINIFFFTIIIFNVMYNAYGMDPRQRNQALLTAYAGFLAPSKISCTIDPTAVSAQFANQEDAQEKCNLLYEFRQEMETENNLLNNTLQCFQNILFQIPAEKNNDEKYLAATIEGKIAEHKKKINNFYADINYYYGLFASPLLSITQKKEVLQQLKQTITNMHVYVIAIEEWEVMQRIFNRVECKRNLKDIALLEESFSKEELLIGHSPAQGIINRLPSQEEIPMSISPPESKAVGMSGYLDWLTKDVQEKRQRFPYVPVVNPSPTISRSKKSKPPTEKFVK